MTNRNANQMNRNQDYIVGIVTTVDTTTHKVLIEDRFGTNYQISLHLRDVLLAIPVVGEGWLIRRTGVDWFLDKRLDAGNESIRLTGMSAGDRRIEAETLYLSATTNVVIQVGQAKLYVDNGSLKFQGGNGTITTIAPA